MITATPNGERTMTTATQTTSFDAAHSWDIGYAYACKGIFRNTPAGTWLTKFSYDFLDGWDQAIEDGNWGSNR